jgi:glycosyltransferase involved in cell wall biosynthesis
VYKNQCKVLDAFIKLRRHGLEVELLLIGGGNGPERDCLERKLSQLSEDREFVFLFDFLSHEEIIRKLSNADCFIFASSCEAFGITLLEGMAAGMPVACSHMSCLPEILEDGGVYFDPLDSDSIACAVEKLIKDPMLAMQLSLHAREIAKRYSWQRSSNETWRYISESYGRQLPVNSAGQLN